MSTEAICFASVLDFQVNNFAMSKRCCNFVLRLSVIPKEYDTS